MNLEIQFREPRSAVLIRFSQLAIRRTGTNRRKFSTEVAEQYQKMISPGERIIAFYAGTTCDAICAAEKKNDQIIRRMMDGSVKMPADIEDAWIAAIPEPFRSNCRAELAARDGLAVLPEIHRGGVVGANAIADLTAQFSTTLKAVAPVLADVDPHGVRHALSAAKSLQGFLIAITNELERSKATGQARA